MCLKSFCDMNHFFFLGSIPVITLTCDTTFSRYFLIYIMHNIFSKSDCFHILKVVMYHVVGLLKVLPLFGTNLCLRRNSKVFMFQNFKYVLYIVQHILEILKHVQGNGNPVGLITCLKSLSPFSQTDQSVKKRQLFIKCALDK